MPNALTVPISLARRLLRRVGIDVVAYDPRSHPIARRARLFHSHGIDLVLDVGANIGQYGLGLREMGYRGRIVSFEPLSAAFSRLSAVAARDRAWEVVQVAVGDRKGTAKLNVAANSQSSSLLPMLSAHVGHAPESAYVAQEEVKVEMLEALAAVHRGDARRPFLKIDAQGYEARILESAGAALETTVGVQIEMSIAPLYEGEELLPAALARMEKLGFTLMSIEPVFSDYATGQLLQLDGIFFRAHP